MRFNIVTNLCNGVGLERDYRLLCGLLEAKGHEVRGVQFNAPVDVQPADVNIFLEVVNPELFQFADEQWAVPNPEWWFAGWNEYLPKFRWVLAKTHDCERIFRSAHCKYIGWMSNDLYRANIKRERKFLHVAGKSLFKNTPELLAGWSGAELTVVSEHFWDTRKPGVTGFKRVTEDDMISLMNAHAFHILPSAYEGWGHALHESLGVGAVIITTDAEPMREFGNVLIPPATTWPHHVATLAKISPSSIAQAVKKTLAMSDDEVIDAGRTNRQKFESETDEFLCNLNALI